MSVPTLELKDSWLRSQREAWRLMSPEYLASILSTFSRAQKSRWLEASDSQRNAWVQAIYRGNNKANIPEIILGLYLESRFPHLFVYNGDGKAGFVVGGKIPDFVNSRDELLVELFGDYWHSPADESELVAYYASRGWRCKVVWEDQVYQEHELDIAFDIGRLGA